VTQSPACKASLVAAPIVMSAADIDVPPFESLPVGDTKYSFEQV
jgi:hypothetical protein